MRSLVVLFLVVLLSGCSKGKDVPPAPEGGPDVKLVPFLTGLQQPVFVTHAGDDAGVLYIVEQVGRIKVWDGTLRETPFLDIGSRISKQGEQGLLGLAFSPAYEEDGRFFVHYTDVAGDTVLARFNAVGPVADAGSERILIQQKQPYRNHNGGSIVFGPDGYLYMALGDGGSAGDPEGNGQDKETRLGKILRLDVSGDGATAAPGNPFEGAAGHPDIWAWGLRNPWRISFDRETGDLWIADVGQTRIEEVNFQPADSEGGENYGWNVYEGGQRFRGSGSVPDHVKPVAEYDHDGGHCSVTGGYVYRGADHPSLEGTYFFGDYCTGTMWSLKRSGEEWKMNRVLDTDFNISSFGEDQDGELYVIHHGGAVLKLAAK